MDYSGRFLDAAMAIQSGKKVGFGDGEVASVPTSEGIDLSNVVFKQVITEKVAWKIPM